MTAGARTALFVGALAAAIVLGAGWKIAAAQAAGPQQPPDLAGEVIAYANSEANAAMAEANAVSSQVPSVQVSVTAPPSTAGDQATAPAAENTAPSPAPPSDPTVAGGGQIEVLSVSPQPQPIAPTTPVAVVVVGAPPILGPVARHHLEGSAHRAKAVVRTSRSVVSRSTSLHAVLRTSATAAIEATSSSSAKSVARSTVRSTVKGSASGGRSPRPTAPDGPRPFPPFPPNAPAPNSGVSSTGGGGGQGALLIFFVPVAALVIFGIHRLLRRVHWSDLRMPRRGAVLPWRPG
jgi:hypothetical protein